MAAFPLRIGSGPAWPRTLIFGVAGALLSGPAVVCAQPQSTELINPFEPPGVVAPATTDAGDADLNALEFSGVSTIMDRRSFNFTDARTRKNFWVPLNGTENGFTVESYDERSEQVVVRRGGRTRPIPLRKSQLVALPASNHLSAPANYAAAPAIATSATVARSSGSGVDEIKNPKTPAEIKQAEFEARMLVSDLLDISMQERARQRALREAQARGQAAPVNATTATAGSNTARR